MVNIVWWEEPAFRQLQREMRDMRFALHRLQGEVSKPAPSPPPHYRVGKASGTITAAAGDTPGSGLVEIYALNLNTGDKVSLSFTRTVYNDIAEPVASGTKVGITRDDSGVWWITEEDCS